MSSLKDVVRQSIIRIRKENKDFIPSEFQKIFCAEMKKAGLKNEECQGFEKFKSRLDRKIQVKLANYNVRTQEEFISFLIGELGRNTTQTAKGNTNGLIVEIILKILLKSVGLFHNKSAKKLADTTLQNLELNQSDKILVIIRDSWIKFIQNFDNPIFKELQNEFNTNDDIEDLLKLIKTQLVSNKFEENENLSLDEFVHILIPALQPSVSGELATKILSLQGKLKANPEELRSGKTKVFIQELIEERKEADKLEIDKNAIDFENRMQQMMQLFSSSKIELKGQEIKTIVDNSNCKDKTLTKAVDALNDEIKHLYENMTTKKDEIKELKKKILNMEDSKKEPEPSEPAEIKLDKIELDLEQYLKKDEFTKIEKSYEEDATDYAIIFFKIENYTDILKSYGDHALRAMVFNIEKVIRNKISSLDILSKMSGGSYMMFINREDYSESYGIIQLIQETIKKSKFIYKGERVYIILNIAIASRSEDRKFEDVMKIGMARLELANKKKDIIVSKDNEEKLMEEFYG